MEQETILVVDDNREIVYSISELLKYEGYNTVNAYDGMEALKAVEENPIDLILLDVMMPRMNGLSALMKLREKYHIPVIILSAKTEESDKVSGLMLGADDYVEKPYNPVELIARVKAHLRRYHLWGSGAPKEDEDRIVNGGLVLDRKQRIAIAEGEEAREIERESLEKVSRSDQLRIDLITNVSHDLKTPLTSMVGYIELMKKEELSDVMRDYVDVLSERAEKLKEMISSLFSLAKASSGNVELKMESFEMNRLIDQIFADMDDRIRESGLEFVTRKTEESTELVSDNMYCYRICQNLLENTLKYSAKGTRVFVKTSVKSGEGASDGSRKGRRICLEITNTSGYLMDFTEEDIVERFARGDRARSSEGNGLGLAIVSTYTKALGGEFDIRIDCDQFRACVELPEKPVSENL